MIFPFSSPMMIPIIAIVGVFLWLIIHSIVAGVQGIVKHRNELELKQTLAQQGMSASEIERVIQARSFPEEGSDS